MAYIPNNNGDEENKDKSVYKQLFNASTVGMALVSGMLVGGAIGYFFFASVFYTIFMFFISLQVYTKHLFISFPFYHPLYFLK